MKIDYKELQRAFENKEIVLVGGDGKAPIKNYAYAVLENGNHDRVEITFFDKNDDHIHSSWGKRAIEKPINKFEIGYFEKNGLSVEFFSKMVISNRNIICRFKIKTQNEERIDNSTEQETIFFQKRINKQDVIKEDDIGAINNLIAKLYYEIIS